MKKYIILIITIIHSLNNCKAQSSVITTSVPYMLIGSDSRAGGMGNVGVATNADGNSIFWNNSKTLFSNNPFQIAVNYTSWFREVGAKDIYLISSSGYKQIDDKSSYTVGLRYFSQGSIQVTNSNGDIQSIYRPRDWDISFGYNRKLNNRIGLGITLRYINSNLSAIGNSNFALYGENTQGIAGDISIYHNGLNQNGEGFNWGINISNLGSKMSYKNISSTEKDYLPANMAIGGNYNWVLNENNKISLALDINKLLVPIFPKESGIDKTDSLNMIEYRKGSVINSWFKSFSDGGGFLNSLSYSIGAEYLYDHLFAARIGYYTEDKNRGNRKFLTAGVSVYYKKIGINLSYLVPTSNSERNILANTMRFGIVFE